MSPSSLLSALFSASSPQSSSTLAYFTRLYYGFYAISILASLWVYHVARRLPPGPMRAAACAPIVLLQMAATPLLIDRLRTPVLIVPVCGTLSLAAFKVAAFAMGRGPLAMQQCKWTQNLLQFGAVLSLPVIPRDAFKLGAGASLSDVGSQAPATWPTFLKLYTQKAGGAAVAGSLATWPVLPELLRHWFYALCLSLTLGALWDFWCCAAVVFAGIPVAPSFDKPWLSTSFADYWSRRWNLTTTYLLRVLIYEPVRDGRFVPEAAPALHDNSAGSTPAAAATKQASSPRHTASTPPSAQTAAAPAGPDEGDDAADSAPATGLRSRTGVKQVSIAANSSTTSSAESSCNNNSSSSNGGVLSSSSLKEAPATATAPLAGDTKDEKAGAAGRAATTTVPLAARRQETPAQAVLRRVAATTATFVFSGLWHMLIWYYATGTVTYHWLLFFSLQGPVMIVEGVLKHYAKAAGFKLPYPVSVFLTNFLLIVIARPLFFGPCDWSGFCTAMMDNVRSSLVMSMPAGGGDYA